MKKLLTDLWGTVVTVISMCCLSAVGFEVGSSSGFADPVHRFPNIDDYPQVPYLIKDLTYTTLWEPLLYFTVPDGGWCDTDSDLIECYGKYPGYFPHGLKNTPVDQENGYEAIAMSSGIGEVRSTGNIDEDWTKDEHTVAVHPGQRVQLGKTLCLVGEHHLLACKSGDHGFVLTDGDAWQF